MKIPPRPPDPPAHAIVPATLRDYGFTFPLPAKLSTWLTKAKPSPVGKGEAELWVRSCLESMSTLGRLTEQFEASRGALSHTIGTYVVEFHQHEVWKLFDLKSFKLFCEKILHIHETTGYRLMYFAKVATFETAPLGVRKCIAGAEIAEILGLRGLGDLLPENPTWREPAEWTEKLGAPVNFQWATATALEALLQTYRERKKLKSAPPGQRVQAVAKKRSRIIEKVRAKHPALERLKVKSFVRDGEARISHKNPATDEEFLALAAMYTAIAKGRE